MTAPVVATADAPEDLLLEAAGLMRAAAEPDAGAWLDTMGPPEGLARSLRAGFEPRHRALVTVLPGVGAGVATLPMDANLDRSEVEVYVLPAARRRGVARGLLAALAGALTADGRTTASFWVPRAGAGEAALSATAAVTGQRQVQVERESVWESGPGTLGLARDARDEALAVATGYTLRSWEGPCPPEWEESLGAALAAMDDAPLGRSSWQPPPHGVGLVRARDRTALDSGLRHHYVVALDRAGGDIAGYTDVAAWPGHPRGQQWDTGVLRAHRGHRLGLLLKAEMALRLAEHEPDLRLLHTWNAEENDHMLAVNARLGWRVEREWVGSEGPVAGLTPPGTAPGADQRR